MAAFRKRGDAWFVQIRRKGFRALYRTFGTKAEGEAWARSQETLIDRKEAPIDHRALKAVTLADIVRRYLDEVTPTKRGADAEAPRIGKMLNAPVCSLSLAALAPSAFAAYRDARLAVVKPGTVRREMYLFRPIINVARREWGVPLPENPIERVASPVVSDGRNRRLRDGDLARLKEALTTTRNPLILPIMLFAIETALRRGELIGLEWQHIDIYRRTAHIPTTKTGHARTIPLTDNAIEILRGLPRGGARPFPITATALRLAWVRVTERAGVPDLRLHDLRHESISRFAETGLTLPELSLISGHRDPRMLERYTHLRPQDLAAKLAGRSWETESRSPVTPVPA
jgi:integrase